MIHYHVVADTLDDGAIQMRRVKSRPNFPESVHHVLLPINQDLMLVVWWPVRYTTKIEQSYNDQVLMELRKIFGE